MARHAMKGTFSHLPYARCIVFGGLLCLPRFCGGIYPLLGCQYALIMYEFYWAMPQDKRPKVFGMSASPNVLGAHVEVGSL